MFQIDGMGRTPVYEQLIAQVHSYVLAGVLAAGDQLPSVRTLAADLSVNPNTIQKAFGELERGGIVQTVPGKGCYVSADAVDILRRARRGELKNLQRQLEGFRMAGVAREEIIHCVDEVYGNGE